MENRVLSVVGRLNNLIFLILMVEFRMSDLCHLVPNILMYRIILLLVISDRLRVHNWVKKMMSFVIKWLFPVVVRHLRFKLIAKRCLMSISFLKYFAFLVLIWSLFIVEVTVSRMDGLVVSYYWFMVSVMMVRRLDSDYLLMELRINVRMVDIVMIYGLVISGLEMCGFVMIDRSGCDMFSHHLFFVMLNFFAFNYLLHLGMISIAIVVMFIVVLGLGMGIGFSVSIIMRFRLFEGMEDSMLEWNCLHIVLIVVSRIKLRLSDMGLAILIMIFFLRHYVFARLDLVLDSRWFLENNRLMHWSLMERSLSLSLMRNRRFRESLLVTRFSFFFDHLVV